MFSAQRLLKAPIAYFGVVLVGLLLITRVTTADQYEEQVAAANADIEKARRDLRRLQARQQEFMRNLDNNHEKHVAETILEMYQTARKYNILEEAVREGEITEEEAIAEFEKFTGIRNGKASLVASFTHAMQEVKKGRLAQLDELDKKISDALLRFQWAHFQLRSVERLRRIERRGSTDDPIVHTWAEDGPLAISASQKHIDMQVGEIKEVTLKLAGSKPPYKLRFASLSGENSRELALDSREPQVVPFSFATPGLRTVEVFVEDESLPRQRASLTLTFRVVEAENEPDPPEEPPEAPNPPSGEDPPAPAKPPAKSTPARPPTNPPPPAKPATPPRGKTTMLTGRFHARLWEAASGPGWVRSSDYSYTPLIVSIDPNGAISGKANFDLPADHFNPGWAQNQTVYSQNLRFTLDGFTDPKSGKTTIKVTEGRRELHHVQKGNNRRIEQIREFNTTLQGWRVPSPRDEDLLANPYVDGMRRNGQAQKQKNFPNIGVGQDGKPTFVQNGFFNHVGIDPQFEPGSYHLTSNVNYWQDESEAGSIDDLKSTGPTKTPVAVWFLEILGPADDDESSDRELLALAIWPRSPVRVAGDTVRLTANAVYSDNVFEAVDVTDKATWRQTRGLQPVIGANGAAQKGRYRVTKSAFDEQGRTRSQYVRAGIRKGIDWTADTVKVVPTRVAEPKEQVDE